MKLKSLVLSLAAVAAGWANAADFTKETEAYKAYVIEEIDLLLTQTEKFAELLKAGKLDEAKALYPLARMHYERSEPLAESFGELDPRIDARLADLEEEAKEAGAKTDEEAQAKAREGWTGYHHIENILWTQNTTQGTEKLAEQLVLDVKELRAKIPTVDVTPDLMITGAVDLLNEVSTSKITGEENIFSKADLYDFTANLEGAEKIFEILRSQVEQKDKALAEEIAKQFAATHQLLAKHNRAKEGYDFVSYDALSEADIKALAEAINRLGEPLSQLGIILE